MVIVLKVTKRSINTHTFITIKNEFIQAFSPFLALRQTLEHTISASSPCVREYTTQFWFIIRIDWSTTSVYGRSLYPGRQALNIP